MSKLGISESESVVWVQRYIHFVILVNMFKNSEYILSFTEFHLFLESSAFKKSQI